MGTVSSTRLELAGEPVELLAERALFWHREQTLFVADLHWGKRETFVVEGIPVPDGLLDEELDRLTRLLARFGAERLVVLGDLIHSRQGVTEEVVERIARWRDGAPECLLVRGNHDRHLAALPRSWSFQTVEEGERLGPFVLCHVPREHPEGYVLAGHIHPAVRLRGRGDGLRLPCFFVSPTHMVLPAFSEFTGGAAIDPAPGDRLFAIAAGTVLEV